MPPMALFNPFPGLRPFEPDEDHLFFGREKEIDELLRRLRSTRFLQVVGASGSGKSSLVRSGLIPALHSGFMARAGTDWRVLIFRPGADPIGNLAASLNAPDVLGTQGELASTNKILLEATLRRSTLGLVEAVRQERIPHDDNILVVVDQFEELFRFRRSRHIENSRDEAVAFFKLLLEAAQQTDIPIYIALTMRADFIGDCMEFPGLPQSVNSGLYLVPRMTRDELRSAITGPVAVAGGDITQRLVLRLLNDLGDDQDQLPVLQHALMRTWDHWKSRRQRGESIDIQDYEAVGGLRNAMSLHAEEAYEEAGAHHSRVIAEKMFKALTDTFSDSRGGRRPTSVEELAAICEAPEAEVIQVIDIFRKSGRSFLTPPPAVALHSQSIVDLSHESLMRCWTRLITWAEEEKESARSYIRISQAASWCTDCTGGLWIDPQLETGLQWRHESRPTAAWAQRYDSNFTEAMDFLDRSEQEREQESKKERRRKQARQTAIYVLVLLLSIVGGLLFLIRQQARRAEDNLRLAKGSVDQILASASNEAGFVGESEYTPQMEEFRRELLGKAKGFYSIFTKEMHRSDHSLNEVATAHIRLGDIYRLLQNYADSAQEYRAAISQLEGLSTKHAGNLDYRRNLGYTHNGLAETLRLWLQTRAQAPKPTWSDAKGEYDAALDVQQRLHQGAPSNADYQQELARTYYCRGILQYDDRLLDDAASDFRRAIDLLEPLTGRTASRSPADQSSNPDPAQEMSRASSNLGLVLQAKKQLPEAQKLFGRAIDIHERLVKNEADKRLYKLELAKFSNNLAKLFLDENRPDLAEPYNHRALDLIEDLASPARPVEMERIGAHLVRGRIVESQSPQDAQKEIERSFAILERYRGSKEHSEFHVMYMHLAYDYLAFAERSLNSGSTEDARQALARVVLLLPELVESDRQKVKEEYQRLQKELRDKRPRKK
jgi:tetratricopeptide (TPR) repeat protein